MTYKIKVDVLDAIKDFYPGLPEFQAELIARSVVDRWDYTQMYDSIVEDITWYADSHDIELEGKDGVEPDRFNRDAGSIARQKLVNNNIHVVNPPNSALFS
tara:strand:+ start:1559 stop:1861 length:303 start_codon:yes stop_codon:yes gene_type:complete